MFQAKDALSKEYHIQHLTYAVVVSLASDNKLLLMVIYSLPSGEKAILPLLQWWFGINRTLWTTASPTQQMTPGLLAPHPISRSMATLVLAAAHWLFQGEGEGVNVA